MVVMASKIRFHFIFDTRKFTSLRHAHHIVEIDVAFRHRMRM